METINNQPPMPLEPVKIITCVLCGMPVDIRWHDAHVIVHERAEMLADILALSRR